MNELKKFSLLKPTLKTPFHVDFEWWRANDNNWHIAVNDMLCAEHQASFSDLLEDQVIDWVDPETAEIHSMAGMASVRSARPPRLPPADGRQNQPSGRCP